MGLEVGTKRYNPEWLRDRLKWRDDEGVPIKADWNLSKTAKNISDLQVWDYRHPEDDKELDEEEKKPEIEDAIADDLELELQNSLSLMPSEELSSEEWAQLSTKLRRRLNWPKGPGQGMQKSGSENTGRRFWQAWLRKLTPKAGKKLSQRWCLK
jgi:hypothetical protein